MPKANQLSRAVRAASLLPAALSRRAITGLFTYKVRFAGTGGIVFEKLAEDIAVLNLKNHKKVQNHIGGVHAAAMALLAESATGAVFGMNVPDSHLPLLKSMKVDYVKRAQGDLRAEASLSEEQRLAIRSQEKGELLVPVKVTDSAGAEPIQVQMIWAWVPKKR